MTQILRDTDADRSLLTRAPVGVVGFGNQGRAQAECLRDSGAEVVVVVRKDGASYHEASAQGFRMGEPRELGECPIVAVLAPDEVQLELLRDWIDPFAPEGCLLVFAHGFTLRSDPAATQRKDFDLALVGPLGPGALLRERYLQGRGLAGLLATVRDESGHARERALAYASCIGLTRAGLLVTTLDEEVVTDLFAEQVVLTGGVVDLMRRAWEVLVEEGYSPEVAYYSCVQELKQILDLVYEEGLAGMRERISGTAQYGGLTRGPRLLDDRAQDEMRRILKEVRTGAFSREWQAERDAGRPELQRRVEDERDHPIEEVGRRVRDELGGSAKGVAPQSRARGG